MTFVCRVVGSLGKYWSRFVQEKRRFEDGCKHGKVDQKSALVY